MIKYFSNKDIAEILRSVAAAYEVKNGSYFKIAAYQNAADSIEHATSELKDLWDDNKLNTVPGLGKSIQLHLEELFQTGQVKHFQEVKKGLPDVMFALLDIGGMGPKTAYKLTKALKIKNVTDLEEKARAGKIRNLSGFGEKSEQDIIDSIMRFRQRSNRYLLTEAFPIAQRVLEYLIQFPECQRVETLGSLRRMVTTVGDIDIAVASNNPKSVISHFAKFKEVSRVLDEGERKSSIILKNGMQIDLMVQPPEAFGALLQHFTGSKNHNIHLREIAHKKGLSLSEYGIKVKGKLKKFRLEEEFYKFLNLDWIEPELREDNGEIESAVSHTLPKLVTIGDIKGDIHLHSNFPIEPSHDLGTASFKEILDKGRNLCYEYIGFSDHSPSYSNHTINEIIDLIKKRTKVIEQIKDSEKNVRILNLLEIDILANGKLSVSDKGLKNLDGAIAGIHSSHNQDKETITNRLLTAINSPYVQIISHPTGRLIMQRESYEADWPVIFEACQKTGTILEINAWPSRMDLPDILVYEAIKKGVKLIINSDSHAIEHMDNLKYGVSVARRGWATAKDIVNTYPWVEFRKIFNV